MIGERLLSVSGGDAQTVARKHKGAVTTRLPVRFVVMSNELPRLSDASGALAKRMLLLQMTESWYGREDTELESRLKSELPGILLWAISGWDRLRRRGRFTTPESSANLMQELQDLVSPVSVFVREKCTIGKGLSVSRSAKRNRP